MSEKRGSLTNRFTDFLPTEMDLLQLADSIEGFAEVQEEEHINEAHGDLKAQIEKLRQELRQLQNETKAQVKVSHCSFGFKMFATKSK
jgi:hypothetical protein